MLAVLVPVLIATVPQVVSSSTCVAPGTCEEPSAVFTNTIAIKPRQQWNIEGGFCGAMSIQVNAMMFGAWISQDLVRKANTHGEGHGDATDGYEVLPSNVAETARNLKLTYDEWDYNQTKPQSDKFKAWIKSHLAKGEPVVWFPMCKGDSHCPYTGSCLNGGHFDHVEPLVGMGSNHDLSDPTVYSDDWLAHFSDQDLNIYYRTFDSLNDDATMEGNCADAQAGFGKNEMYPCFDESVTFGLSVTGLRTGVPTLRVSLDVDLQSEPDVREFWELPAELSATLTVHGLTVGNSYVLYRYSGTAALPSSNFEDGYEHKYAFTAVAETWSFSDPNKFMSNGATYYVAVPASSSVVV